MRSRGAREALAGVWLELLAASWMAMDVIWDPFGVLEMLFSTHIIDTMVKDLFLSIFGPNTTVKIDVSPRRELDFHENTDFDN